MWGQPCGGSIPLARTIEDKPYSIRVFCFARQKIPQAVTRFAILIAKEPVDWDES